jgi:hypothetical protein
MRHYECFQVFDRVHKRHWSPISEAYTGTDSLLTALDTGWQIEHLVMERADGNRPQPGTLYAFTLQRGRTIVVMRVIANPCVTRLVEQLIHRAGHRNRAQTRIPHAHHRSEYI